MNKGPFSDDFWTSDANHIAVNPLRPDDAKGLAEFAVACGLGGICFFQTSGSEGTPKWVALSKKSFLISGNAVNAHFEVTSQDRWLVALPVHHVGGFAIHARAHLSGSTVVELQAGKWVPAAFAQACEDHATTLVSLVPAQVHDLVRDRVPAPVTLRAAIIGGGGMTQELANQAQALGWRVFQSYGMTEAASQIATQPYNPFGAVFDVASLEVLPHWQVQLDDGGHLVLQGPALARGYARCSSEGGWAWEAIDLVAGLRTRDRVRLWEHGTARFLEFVGRESGYVKVLGELIHLAPLQARAENLATAANWSSLPVITVVPDLRRDSSIVLVAESSQEEAAALMQDFNLQTEPLCCVQRAIVLPQIPRTSLGKVDAPALRGLLAALSP